MDRQPSTPSDRMNALGRAMEVYRQWRADPAGVTGSELCDRHPDLSDLLQPLVAAPEDDPDDGESGDHLGDYQLEAEIGRGGMGVVFRAVDRRLGRRVAVKMLAPHLLGDQKSLARFRREAATVAALNYPGIVDVYGVGEQDGRWFYAMELVDGAPLDRIIAILRDRRDRSAAVVGDVVRELSPVLAGAETATRATPTTSPFDGGSHIKCMVALGIQLCEAVAHAHLSGVLHRDLKPANVLVTPAGRVVLTDFGLARTGDAPSVTVTGHFAGTPYYVSPEQARGDWQHVGQAADVFSLGATLFEMLLIQRPFEASSAQEVLDRIRGPEPVAGVEMRARLPRDLAAILTKALEKDPGERYPSAVELAADLRAHAELRPVAARHPGPARRVLRWARRERLRAVFAATLALGLPVVVGLGGYLLAKAPAIAAGERERAYQDQRARMGRAYAALIRDPYGDDALAQFRALLQETPGNLDASVGIVLHGLLQRGSGRREGVDVDLRELGGDPEAHPVLGAMVGETDNAALAVETGGADAYHAAGIYNYMFGRGYGDRSRMVVGLDQLQRAVLLSPRPVEVYLAGLAHCAFDLGERAVVQRAAEALAAHFPSSLYSAVTRAYVWSDHRPDAAMAAAELAVRLDPGGRVSATRLAALHAEAGRSAQARQIYLQVLERHPRDVVALSNMCYLALADGDLDQARKWIAGLAEAHPADPGLLRARARLAMLEADHAAAETHLTALQNVAGWNAQDAADLVMALIHQQKGAAAEAIARDALALHPGDERLAIRHVQAIQVARGAGPALEQLRATALETADALALRGALLALLGRFDEAVDDLVAADALGPLGPGPCRNLLIALKESGRAAEAVTRGRAFVAEYPEDPRLHDVMVELLFEVGSPDDVLDEVWRHSSHLAERGRFDAAIQVMERMLPLPPPPTVSAAAGQQFMNRLEGIRRSADIGSRDR